MMNSCLLWLNLLADMFMPGGIGWKLSSVHPQYLIRTNWLVVLDI
jgi:hypothetical protein